MGNTYATLCETPPPNPGPNPEPEPVDPNFAEGPPWGVGTATTVQCFCCISRRVAIAAATPSSNTPEGSVEVSLEVSSS